MSPFIVFNDIDGFPAHPDTFATIEEAKAWRLEFMNRFMAQGYYSSPHGRVDMEYILEEPDDFFPIVPSGSLDEVTALATEGILINEGVPVNSKKGDENA